LLEGHEGDDLLTGSDGDDVLLGGHGRDTLDGTGGNDVLVGHAGDDKLDAGGDSDVLIGGLGKDSLAGRSGDDLLIGGWSQYDFDFDELRQIRELWSSGDTYAARITALEDPLAALNLKSEQTVFDDAVADEIFGNDGADWFFLTGALQAYHPVMPKQVQQGGPRHHHEQPPPTSNLPLLEGFDFLDALDRLADVRKYEQIHTVVPHGTDPSKMGEHFALFQLLRYDQVTHIAMADGPWSSPNTWHDGMIPAAGANVLIPSGVTVTVDGVLPAELHTVRVDGTLRFDPHVFTELRVDTLGVTSGGTLEMGTLKAPIQPDVTARLVIADHGPIDRAWDPYGLSRGLVSHGTVSIYGAGKLSHAPVLVPPRAGTDMIVLSEVPDGWRVGDRIVVAGTESGHAQDEVREIRAIIGRFVQVAPLQYNHLPPDTSLQVHVANLTRNAVIESENSALDRRGHVMFMHSRDVDVNHAGFYHLGRTDKLHVVDDPVLGEAWKLQAGTGTNPRGRYAVHFHRNGVVNDGNPSTVHGSVVVDSPGWGYVNHSSFVEFTDNVSYDVDGSGFVTEAGDEIGTFRDNIAIRSTGTGAHPNLREIQQDFGHEGNGFWFQGTGVAVTGNIASGHSGNGFMFYTKGLNHGKADEREFLAINLEDPSIAGGHDTIDTTHVPMQEFRDNIAYASATGLEVRYHLRNAPHLEHSVIERSTFWNNDTGVDLPYTHNLVLRDLRIIRPFGLNDGTGVDSNLVTRDITYENLTIAGYRRGIDVPRGGYAIIRGGHFNNLQNIVVRMASGTGRSVLITGDVSFGAFPPGVLEREVQYEVYMRPQFEWDGLEMTRGFLDNQVTLDYGTYSNAQVYFHTQPAWQVPFPSPIAGIPNGYVGLANEELWSRFGLAIGGRLAPPEAVEVRGIFGLVLPGG
jgi:hypothetical protein